MLNRFVVLHVPEGETERVGGCTQLEGCNHQSINCVPQSQPFCSMALESRPSIRFFEILVADLHIA